jgi:hypothetical protein
MLHKIFAPMLYTRCRIKNLSSILVSLEHDNEMVKKIEHLDLYSGIQTEEPTYQELIVDDFWRFLANPPNNHDAFAYQKQVQINSDLATQLRAAIIRERITFPMLRSVSLGGYGDFHWTSIAARRMEPTLLAGFGLDNFEGIPRYFLGHSTIEHLCQSVNYGPLALSALIYKPATPLKVYTYHVRYPPDACVCGQEVAPIIVGAINRYYFVNAFTVNESHAKIWSRSRQRRKFLIGAILKSLTSREMIVSTHTFGSYREYKNYIPVDNTVIELYDYIRFVKPVTEDPNCSAAQRGYTARACRAAQPLTDIQVELDNSLPHEWRGKVLLKDREEAPPCTACGFDLMARWEYKVSSGDMTDGHGPMCAACEVYAEDYGDEDDH